MHPSISRAVLRAIVERNGVDPVLIDDVVDGLRDASREQAATSPAMPARCRMPDSVPARPSDRQCGSRSRPRIRRPGCDRRRVHVVVAAGVEVMTRVPMALRSWTASRPVRAKVGSLRPEGGLCRRDIAELIADK